ncbi:sigma factor-binding protein Crl [Lonsdalea britannica]|uniref:sigma factor-binding protein Crl n=1 Tax=Lonsdalea britannica TaxID=1082704 RepID=UPI0026EE465B|nr:sigma factor-binding protein Crl [Lonsdalea britannica]
MTLPCGHTRHRLIKNFTSLGPYLREGQCHDFYFFFDCLAMCVDVKAEPEKREFWGWWLDLDAQGQSMTYSYRYGLFDEAGNWSEIKFKDKAITEKVNTTRESFHKRLAVLVQQLDPPYSLTERP